jgi:hypothetical protein
LSLAKTASLVAAGMWRVCSSLLSVVRVVVRENLVERGLEYSLVEGLPELV